MKKVILILTALILLLSTAEVTGKTTCLDPLIETTLPAIQLEIL